MKIEFTHLAEHAIAERNIDLDWVKLTIDDPDLREPDPLDETVERFFRRIPERGDCVLRVAVNTAVEPARVVSVFFDRTRKGKL